ncbi:MAG: SPW repeat domain-containing protein [Chloroflexota bacterium]
MVSPPWNTQVRIASGLTALVALWLIAAPFVLGYSTLPAATATDLIVGLIVLILAGVRWAGPFLAVGLSWAIVGLGLWLILAPFVFGYATISSPTSNQVAMGVVIAALGTWGGLASTWAPTG